MTVQDALQFGGLRNASVVAGFSGLSRPLESVSVLEIAEASISTWTMQNQLYITSFYAIANDIPMQKVVIRSLNESHCCGLVICHIQYVLHQIDPSILDLCNELSFPLIIADTDILFVDIINPIFSRLSNLSGDSIEGSGVNTVQFSADYFNLLMSNRSVPEILHIFAYQTGHEMSFLDAHFNCLYSNKSEPEKQAEYTYLHQNIVWSELNVSRASYHTTLLSGRQNMIYFIKRKDTLFGFLCIKYRPGDTDIQVLAIADSLNIPCALLLNKTSRLHNSSYEYQQTFFSDLLVWNFPSTEIALRRAEDLGYQLQDKHNIIVININSLQSCSQKEQELRNYINQWFLPPVRSLVKSCSPSNIVHFHSDMILIFLEEPTQSSSIYALAEKLLSLFLNSEIGSVSVGISRPFQQPTDIPRAYTEAFDIAILGRNLLGGNRIANFQNLGLLYYLKTMKSDIRAASLCKEIIEPLRANDEAKGTELVKTAYTLFLHNLDSRVCANQLHIHRNTLLYRKNQIQELLGYDPFIQPHAFHFMAALLLSHI